MRDRAFAAAICGAWAAPAEGVATDGPENAPTPSGDAPAPPAGHSDRVIDPTRQGIASVSPEPSAVRGADPVSAEQACAAVDGWLDSGMPLFGLHQVAVALRRELASSERDVLNLRAPAGEHEAEDTAA